MVGDSWSDDGRYKSTAGMEDEMVTVVLDGCKVFIEVEGVVFMHVYPDEKQAREFFDFANKVYQAQWN